MALIPSGHIRVMKTQTVSNFDSGLKEIFAQMAADPARNDVTQQPIGQNAGSDMTGAAPSSGEPLSAPTGTPGMTPDNNPQQPEEQPGSDAAGQALNVGKQEVPVDEQKFQNSLTKFVLQQIVHWKWPERLAVTKQEEMVDEKIMPDGQRNFTIVVPNIYYGGDVISNEDFQGFIQNLTRKFGIHFQGANRKGKKATLQFSTTRQEMQIDPLSDVYGKGSGSSPKAKAAYTMGEILTARKDQLYETMRKFATQEKH